MSRYIGPRLRIIRRLGLLPGLTRKNTKNLLLLCYSIKHIYLQLRLNYINFLQLILNHRSYCFLVELFIESGQATLVAIGFLS
jgi:hypothetical protein